MNCRRIARISLRVESLRQAENLYTRLFDLKVVQREGAVNEEPCELPGNMTWEEITSSDVTLTRSVLHSDGFCLTLHRNTAEAFARGRLDHIGLCLEPGEFQRLWGQVSDLGCYVEEAADQRIIFDDPYGVRWEVMADAP
jgi:catechol 2,3-dioxygenase-like lactoylglutathione lyase family enzyme